MTQTLEERVEAWIAKLYPTDEKQAAKLCDEAEQLIRDLWAENTLLRERLSSLERCPDSGAQKWNIEDFYKGEVCQH